MATIKKYNGSTWENAVVRKYGTASEIITPPTTIYADGTSISTYTIKGNVVQSGTPTPSNPVPVVGVGELETIGDHTGEYKIPILSNGVSYPIYLSEPLRKIGDSVDTAPSSGTVTRYITSITYDGSADENWSNQNPGYVICCSISKPQSIERASNLIMSNAFIATSSNNVGVGEMYAGGSYLNFNYDGTNDLTTWKAYLAANPVTVWYVLATPTTETVTAPSIPTTEGANSITIDTTVQPSEFTATWTGWHDSSVKEWDGSDWQ